MVMVKVKGLTKYLNKKKILKNICLELDLQAGIIGVFGPNGSGKTTFLKILSTVIQPDEGKVIIDNLDKPQEIRKRIGVVFQVPSLDPEISVYDNMIFHSMLYLGYVDENKINSLLKEFGLEKYKYYKVKELSGGTIRRVEIVRCLIHDPKIIFLDEPDAGLDPKIRKTLWKFLYQIKKQKKILIFLITHNIDEVENICDYCIFMRNGKIVRFDTPENIKSLLGGKIVKVKTNNEKVIDFIKKNFSNVVCVKNYFEIFLDNNSNLLKRIFDYIDYLEELSIKKPSLSDYLLELLNE